MNYFQLILLFFTIFNYNCVKGDEPEGCEAKWPKCRDAQHTVCASGGNCDPKDSECVPVNMTNSFRNLLVERHNVLRKQVASGKEKRGYAKSGSNIMVINYDFDLEYTASCVSNTCEMKHDKCRGTPKFPSAGQNLYSGSSEELMKGAVDLFYEEIVKMKKRYYDSYEFVHGTGHFTQVIWAKTTHIGCAAAHKGSKYVLACNYGPAGNMIGDKIYLKGRPATKCPDRIKSKKYKGLCGKAYALKDTGREFVLIDGALAKRASCYLLFGEIIIIFTNI